MDAGKTNGDKMRRLGLAAALLATMLLVVGSVWILAGSIEDRLNENAERQAITYTEQAACTVSAQLELLQATIDSFSIESTDLPRVQASLAALVESYGFVNAHFAGMDGLGISADGQPFSVEDLSVPDTALSECVYSFSRSFNDAQGNRIRIGQKPLFLDGKQAGAVYLEVPMSLFTMEDELDILGQNGYFLLFEGFAGEVINAPQQPVATPLSAGDSVFDFLARAQVADSRPADMIGSTISMFRVVKTTPAGSYDAIRSYVEAGKSGAVTSLMDGIPCYVAVAPVAKSTWFACSVVPIANVRTEAPVVNMAFWIMLCVVALCLGAVAVLVLQFYRRRVKAEQVREEERLYGALSESIDMAVNLYCPVEGRTTPIVAKTAAILGYPLQDFMDDPALCDAVELSPEGRKLLERMRNGDICRLEKGELSLRSPETGQLKWAVYAVEPLCFEERDQLMIVLQDVTTERTVRECMREAMDAADSANHAKSDFLSRMSHDIRTPMNVIIGMSQIAQAPACDEAKMRVCLQKIGIASTQLLNLINEVLDFSKIESGKMVLSNSQFSLPRLVESVANIARVQADQAGQAFRMELDCDDVTEFVGDSVRLEQMLMNLLTNAVKYTGEGGHVRLIVRVLPEKVAGYRPVEFMVSDDGIGMSEEFQKDLFEPFAMEGRSQSQGTGLGMSIVKSIVMLMGGLITVDSKENEGTTFRVLVNIRTAGTPLGESVRVEAALLAEAAPHEGQAAQDTPALGVEKFEDAMESAGLPKDGAAKAGEANPVRLGVRCEAAHSGAGATGRGAAERKAGTSSSSATSAAGAQTGSAASAASGTAQLATGPIAQAADTPANVEAPLSGARDAAGGPGAGASSHATGSAHKPGEGIHVLVVEDNEINTEIACELLHMSGFTSDTACNGAEALKRFSRSPEGTYDVVLMDVHMPVMNGYEATRAIRALDRPDASRVVIIAMSANAFTDDVTASMEAGMDAHLSKPMKIDRVAQVICEQLAARTTSEK